MLILIPVPRIENKRKEKKIKENKVQQKVKRNLGPNFVSLTRALPNTNISIKER